MVSYDTRNKGHWVAPIHRSQFGIGIKTKLFHSDFFCIQHRHNCNLALTNRYLAWPAHHLERNSRREMRSSFRWPRQTRKLRNGENAPMITEGTTAFRDLVICQLPAFDSFNNPLILCPTLCRLKVRRAFVPRDGKVLLLYVRCYTKYKPLNMIGLRSPFPTAATRVDRWICKSDIFHCGPRWCRYLRLQSEPIHWPFWRDFWFASELSRGSHVAEYELSPWSGDRDTLTVLFGVTMAIYTPKESGTSWEARHGCHLFSWRGTMP